MRDGRVMARGPRPLLFALDYPGLAFLALGVPFGLAVLAAQTYMWIADGLWPPVPLAAALTYLGIDLSLIYSPSDWQTFADIAAWVLDLPLWSVALWLPATIVILMLPSFLISFVFAFGEGFSGRLVFWFGNAHTYRQQAEAGDPAAQNNLGFLYEKGWDLPQDYVQAHMWYNIAAATHPPGKRRDESVRNRDRLAKRITAVQLAEAHGKAREWLTRRGAAAS